jgi:hypothetical protein
VKKYYLASRAMMVRPYGIGPTQWCAIYQLASEEPTNQRILVCMLDGERAT